MAVLSLHRLSAPTALDPVSASYTVASNDPLATLVAGHNRRVELRALLSPPAVRPGTILVADRLGKALFAYDRGTDILRKLSSGQLFREPKDVMVDRSGQIFVHDPGALGGTGAILHVDAITGQQEIVFAGKFRAVIADPLHAGMLHALLPDEFGQQTVSRIDFAAGSIQAFTTFAEGSFSEPPTMLSPRPDGTTRAVATSSVVDVDGLHEDIAFGDVFIAASNQRIVAVGHTHDENVVVATRALTEADGVTFISEHVFVVQLQNPLITREVFSGVVLGREIVSVAGDHEGGLVILTARALSRVHPTLSGPVTQADTLTLFLAFQGAAGAAVVPPPPPP